MTDNIVDGDIFWDREGYLEFIFDGISDGHYDGNSRGVIDEPFEGETLRPIVSTLLVDADSYKIEKYLYCK